MSKRFWIYLIFNIVLFAQFSYIGYLNFTALVAHNPNMNHNELFYTLLSFITLAFIIGIYVMGFAGIKQKQKLIQYQRELERRGVDRDESSNKIKVLESKIVVLEKALQDALKDRNN